MKIKVGFFAVCLLLAWIVSERTYGIAGLLAATLHELGHIGVAKLLGVPFGSLTLSSLGMALRPRRGLGSYTDELLIAAAGPFVNLLSALTVWPFSRATEGFLSSFLIASLFLGLLNLLPISELDGGRILSCLIARRRDPAPIVAVSSFLIIFILWALSVYLLLRMGCSLALFIFSCSLFCRLFVGSQKTL